MSESGLFSRAEDHGTTQKETEMNRLTDPLNVRLWRIALAGAALATTATTAIPAHAQEAAAEPARNLEEIVVTAQKREQTLMEIPQSITVLDGGVLQRQQADNFKEYLKLIPGLSLEGNTPGISRITLRGVNTGGVASTVGVYVDEVPFGSSSGLANGAILSGDFDTFDVARLEVLRGPQGTLYGASSLGGVLRFVTNAPNTQEFELRAEAGIEDVADGDLGESFRGLINVPLSDSVAVRFSGFYRQDAGYIDSIGNNPIPSLLDPSVPVIEGSRVEEDINDLDTFGGRLSGLFEPGDDFSVRLTAMFQNLDSGASHFYEGDPDTFDPLYGGLVQSLYNDEFDDIEYRVFSGTLDWDTALGNVVSSTSYSTFEQDFQFSQSLAFAPAVSFVFGRPLGVLTVQTTATDKFTQELRLASSGDSAFEWLVGAFYTREKSQIDPQDFFAVEAGTDTIAGDIPRLVEIFLRSTYEEYAAFANATWSVTDRFDLTLGGRASRNEQDANQLLDGAPLGIPRTEFEEANSSEDVFTWSLAPRFEFSDDTAAYARIATGYRPGGPNVLPPGTPPGTPGSYESDTLTSYEIGLKADWLDNRLLLDLAAFYLDWDDIQLFAVVNDVGINANGGTAVSKGLEFAATATLMDNLTVSLNGAWTDAYLTEDTHPVVGGLDGDPLPWVPEWSSSVALDYEWSVRGDVTAWVGGDVSYVGERTDEFSNRNAAGEIREAESYTTVDLRAGFDTGRWTFEAYARNLTDERGITALSGFDPTVSAAGAAEVGIIRPRAVGLTVGVEF